MKPEIDQLIEISKFYGSNKDYVIAGDGYSSCKDETIWIKECGHSPADLSEEGFIAFKREKL